jgi:hypothetical protein
MAAVARLTRNLSQERASVLAKEAIELSTAGNVEVRDASSLAVCFKCHRGGFDRSGPNLNDATRRPTHFAFCQRRFHLRQPLNCILTVCVRTRLANFVKLLLSDMTTQTSRLRS